jgi:hypothetical protein
VNDDVRSRIIMPIVLPIVVLISIAAFVGAIAMTLLYNTQSGAIMLAAVAAGGILFTVSLASSQEQLDAPRRGVVVFAGVLPLLVGGALAVGLIGGIEDEQRMANVQPLLTIPDGTPWIGAENSLDFCFLDETNENCVEDADLWEVVPDPEAETLTFAFNNLEAGIPHNVVIAELEGTADSPEQGEDILDSELISGVQSDYYVDEELTWDDLPEEWYFYCIVHANMNGVGTVVEGEA